MKKGGELLFILFFLIGILNIKDFSYAELQVGVQNEDIIVNVSPRNPEPYQNTTITITSYSTDLNKASITWQKGKELLLSGTGRTSYSFKTTGPNTTMVFDITIKPAGSISMINKRVSISPSEIELLWEPVNSYTPPFYKGKALPTKGSSIKAVAIPNTNTIKSNLGSISYTWKNNNEVVEDSSGYNKNYYLFKDDIYSGDGNNITVVASSVENNYTAEKSINIPIYSSRVLFYKKSPTEGVLYNNNIKNNYIMSEDEMTVVAEPYYLDIKNKWNAFSYDWKINGSAIQTPLSKTELTIRPSSRGGYATINVAFDNANDLFQKIIGVLKINL